MALVSTASPSKSPYDLPSSPYANSSEPHHIRALPSIQTSPSTTSAVGLRPHSHHSGQSGVGGAQGSSSPSQTRRPLPSPAPVRSPSAPPFLESGPPNRSHSASPRRHSPSPSPSGRPSLNPSGASAGPSHHSTSSSSSIPRVPQRASSSSPSSSAAPPSLSYPHFSQSPYIHLPPAVASAQGHNYPNPQYPFIPSPHPYSHPLGYQAQAPGPYSPGFSTDQQQRFNADQQRMLQAQYQQQQQWQADMMRNQQLQQQREWGVNQQEGECDCLFSLLVVRGSGWAFGCTFEQASYRCSFRVARDRSPSDSREGKSLIFKPLLLPGQSVRRRAMSGPAPSNPSHQSPTPPFFPATGSHNYPTRPNSIHTQQQQQQPGIPSFPPGARLPFQGNVYPPTPPASAEGSRDPSNKEGFHPYRRGTSAHRSATVDDSNSNAKLARTLPPTTLPNQQHASKSSSSSLPSNATHSRRDSAVYSPQNFPSLPTRVPSSSSTATISPKNNPNQAPALFDPTTSNHTRQGSSASSLKASSAKPVSSTSTSSSPAPAVARARTASSPSTTSSSGPQTMPRLRTESSSSTGGREGNVRSPTPTGPNAPAGKGRPSPLSRSATPTPSSTSTSEPSTPRPGTPGTVRGGRDEDDEDSDDTTGAVIAPPAVVLEKKGMKNKFKKAFSLSGSSSRSSSLAPALTDADLNGRGATAPPRRLRSDSVSSVESEALPRIPPTTTSSRPPSTGGRRLFGNSKLNSSTDNISISSTVSSASVMIRKLGQMGGKLARRNSLMSLTKAFKSKKDDEDGVEAIDPSTPAGSSSSTNKLSKKDKKKSGLATANVSHVTAEIESSQTAGMSPAAALAKKHQLQYAEQEAAAAAQLAPPRSFAVHARTDSNASDTSVKSAGRSWGRSKTTDDVVEGGAANARALEKEKERLKSRKPKKWGVFGGGGGSSSSTAGGEGEDTQPESDDAPTPRQSFEVLASPATTKLAPLPYTNYGREREEESNEVDSRTGVGAEDEYEPSFVGPPNGGHRRDARGVRGILKGAGTYNQEDFSNSRPRDRQRASSFDAPYQQQRPGSPGNAALVGRIPSEAQVDGVVPSSTSSRNDTVPPSPPEFLSHPAPNSPYSNPGMNVSAPVIPHTFSGVPLRSASTPGVSSRHIVFAQNLSIHTTWPAAIYDRRAEPSTSNRLTPALAQRIKEELNAFKMEEMEVHPGSRQLTHFCQFSPFCDIFRARNSFADTTFEHSRLSCLHQHLIQSSLNHKASADSPD
ncbi:hypothetical protein P7C70_g7350, partial [Phenoliferia sp. Uapishka_3]